MNSILIVFPILTLLMFDLGLSLEFKDFYMVVKRPRAMLAGMLGQLILLSRRQFIERILQACRRIDRGVVDRGVLITVGTLGESQHGRVGGAAHQGGDEGLSRSESHRRKDRT